MVIMEIKDRERPYFCKGDEDNKIGFIFSYPSSKTRSVGKPIYGHFSLSFNNLLCKLNKKYPEEFPFSDWSHYRITSIYPQEISYNMQLNDLNIIGSEHNLRRIKEEIKDLEKIICFGEKASFAIAKVIKAHNLNIEVIKVRNIVPSSVSRSIKIFGKQNAPRIRTDFIVLDVFNAISKYLN